MALTKSQATGGAAIVGTLFSEPMFMFFNAMSNWSDTWAGSFVGVLHFMSSQTWQIAALQVSIIGFGHLVGKDYDPDDLFGVQNGNGAASHEEKPVPEEKKDAQTTAG